MGVFGKLVRRLIVVVVILLPSYHVYQTLRASNTAILHQTMNPDTDFKIWRSQGAYTFKWDEEALRSGIPTSSKAELSVGGIRVIDTPFSKNGEIQIYSSTKYSANEEFQIDLESTDVFFSSKKLDKKNFSQYENQIGTSYELLMTDLKDRKTEFIAHIREIRQIQLLYWAKWLLVSALVCILLYLSEILLIIKKYLIKLEGKWEETANFKERNTTCWRTLNNWTRGILAVSVLLVPTYYLIHTLLIPNYAILHQTMNPDRSAAIWKKQGAYTFSWEDNREKEKKNRSSKSELSIEGLHISDYPFKKEAIPQVYTLNEKSKKYEFRIDIDSGEIYFRGQPINKESSSLFSKEVDLNYKEVTSLLAQEKEKLVEHLNEIRSEKAISWIVWLFVSVLIVLLLYFKDIIFFLRKEMMDSSQNFEM